MFISSTRSYCTATGEQRAAGRFLVVFISTDAKNEAGKFEIRALVRRAEMKQCGHWMMASIKVRSDRAVAKNDPEREWDTAWFRRVYDGYYKMVLSGAYGYDGLPMNVDNYPGLWDQLHKVPEDLQAKFWARGGHNCAGSEAVSMHEWASENMEELTRLRTPDANAAQHPTDTTAI